MAAYSVARSKHATLVAATVDTVTFSTDWQSVEILNRATSGDIYATVDGTTPVSGADDTIFVGPNQAVTVRLPTTGAGTDVIKLISAGTPAYSVMGA
jgi:hypothetical protein